MDEEKTKIDHGITKDLFKTNAELSAYLYEDVIKDMIESGRYRVGKHIKGCLIEAHYPNGILIRKETAMEPYRMFLSWSDLYLIEHNSIDTREVSFI